MKRLIALCLILVLLPTGASAITRDRLDEAIANIEGTFETREEMQAACITALELPEDVMRRQTERTGTNRPEFYRLRRCITILQKRTIPVHLKRFSRLEQRQEALQRYTDRYLRSEPRRLASARQDRLRIKRDQQVFDRKKLGETQLRVRSEKRRAVQTARRINDRALDAVINLRAEANAACGRKLGILRSHCIREQLEKLKYTKEQLEEAGELE